MVDQVGGSSISSLLRTTSNTMKNAVRSTAQTIIDAPQTATSQGGGLSATNTASLQSVNANTRLPRGSLLDITV